RRGSHPQRRRHGAGAQRHSGGVATGNGELARAHERVAVAPVLPLDVRRAEWARLRGRPGENHVLPRSDRHGTLDRRPVQCIRESRLWLRGDVRCGKILIVGGGSPTSTAEVIDISSGTGTWRSVASMAVARRQMNATLLADGTVLGTGGTNASGFNTAPTDDRVLAAELWNPTSEKWTTLARMTHYRLYHSTALLLPDGRILSVGSGQPAATGLTDDLTAE